MMEESQVKNMKIKILEDVKNENKYLKKALYSIKKELNDEKKKNEDIINKYNNIVENNSNYEEIINKLKTNITE